MKYILKNLGQLVLGIVILVGAFALLGCAVWVVAQAARAYPEEAAIMSNVVLLGGVGFVFLVGGLAIGKVVTGESID